MARLYRHDRTSEVVTGETAHEDLHVHLHRHPEGSGTHTWDLDKHL